MSWAAVKYDQARRRQATLLEEVYHDYEHHIRNWSREGAQGKVAAEMTSMPPLCSGSFKSTPFEMEYRAPVRSQREHSVDVMMCYVRLASYHENGILRHPWVVEIRRAVRWVNRSREVKIWEPLYAKEVRGFFAAYAHSCLPDGGSYDLRQAGVGIVAGPCTSWRDAVDQTRDALDMEAVARHFGRLIYDRSGWLEARWANRNRYSTLPRFTDGQWAAMTGDAEAVATTRACDVFYSWNKLTSCQEFNRNVLLVGPDASGRCEVWTGDYSRREPNETIDFADYAASLLVAAPELDGVG